MSLRSLDLLASKGPTLVTLHVTTENNDTRAGAHFPKMT